jgi:hypothetical protein
MKRHPRPPQVVPAILVTFGLLLGGCTGSSDTGGAHDGTSPSASKSSEPAAAGSAAPQHLFEVPTRVSLVPGIYQFSVVANPGVETPEALVEIPSGFASGDVFWVVSPDGDAFLGLWTVGKVERDACLHGDEDAFDPGPSVEDLADALVAQKSTRASAPKSVTLAGYQGLYVELASPRDLSKCDPAPGIWGGRGIYNNGQVDLVWILDVDGQRIVVNSAYAPKATAAERGKLTSMVESLEFVAAPGG